MQEKMPSLEECLSWLRATLRADEASGLGTVNMIAVISWVIENEIRERQYPSVIIHQSPWAINGSYVSEPVLERVRGGGVRLVIEVSEQTAVTLQRKWSLAIVPAPLDATDALVLATRGLASATNELGNLLKMLREKL
jgi:hypothetical protein